MRSARGVLTAIVVSAALPGCRPAGESDAPCVRIRQTTWRVELALDDEARHKGMGGRREIPQGTGMLFVFPRQEVLSFHMLDCHVPIDVAFISADLEVVEMHTMPVERDPGHPRHLYSSRDPVRFALEVAGGQLARAGVKVRDRVELLGSAKGATKAVR